MNPFFTMMLTIFMFASTACGSDAVAPAQPDASAMCAGCRMRVSDLRFAAQLVATGEEPRFFDDLGCMRKYVAAHRNDAPWTAFVSDYHTRSWLAAGAAKYWKCAAVETPMSSHIVATAADGAKPAGDCAAMTAAEVFGAEGAPKGK